MKCLGCNSIATTPTTLLDGRVVCTSCEDWRNECEARFIAGLDTSADRAQWLTDIEKKRGKPAANALREFITANWRGLRA